MTTSYDVFIEKFIRKVSEYKLGMLVDDDKTYFVDSLLKDACDRFNRLCLQDLTDRDDLVREFNFVVDISVIDILIEIMISEWLKPYKYSSENLENILNTKDFNGYSPANLLKEIATVADKSELKAERLQKNYSHFYGKVNEVRL